ncbi:Protein of unknown function [Desulfocicer vacuolatum DSM 3385]|uniref:DUF3124 domain-containing protein n=1 Tax=Desulfocicer vacuolatum DSM 3385 TaxID=1121400 RepID=A0A1W2AUW8_9BACT|nr:DUF3124 domain-containing protein [Desulfocicer vacuolatum]SMC64483.1 Protein of unknown function [Desulfocicer vacuolatum DSM 3385]
MKKIYFSPVLLVCFILSQIPTSVYAGETTGLSKGQTIYVPAYSHIYSGNQERPFLLTVTVSIRNIDPGQSITIMSVDYYETQGNLLTQFMETPVILKPLGAIRYVIPEKDKAGGSGANFIVKWKSGKSVNPPIVESIMIGAKSGQGISFTSRGQAIITGE